MVEEKVDNRHYTEPKTEEALARKRMKVGRPRGTSSKKSIKLGNDAKEMIQMVFEGVGGYIRFREWAMDNLDKFYQMYSKLLPIDIKQEVVVRFVELRDLGDDDVIRLYNAIREKMMSKWGDIVEARVVHEEEESRG